MAAQTSAIDFAAPIKATKSRGIWADAFVRIVREKPMGLFGGLLVVMFIVMAAGAPLIAPFGPNELGAGERLIGPSSNIFGTDNLGRDIFSRVVYGARVSITISLVAVGAATFISLGLGIVSGFFGGWVDTIIQRFVDGFIAFPGLVLLLAVVAVFRGAEAPFLPRDGLFRTEIVLLMITIGMLLGVGNSRVIRGSTLVVSNETYVEAARAIGASNTRIMFSYILPNVMAPMITLATLGLGTAILIEASLSFLGLGVPPDVATWGGMLNREARAFMTESPWIAVFPGLALSLAVFGFNMLGDALRDVLDPRLRT
ncbi:MAG: ABC transporter permease [Chloroflexi bacterium]|nr:ABC transporter permease [Chloroflexota bacterium]MDA1147998.1 ABC transporter permease [Chloroflexota bacterium]